MYSEVVLACFKYSLLHCQVPGVGLLELPSLPDTELYRDEEMEYAAGGLTITPVEAMQKWKLNFEGKMRWVSPAYFIKAACRVDFLDLVFPLHCFIWHPMQGVYCMKGFLIRNILNITNVTSRKGVRFLG